MRPVLPALRPLRTGSILLFAGVTLALAAGTLGPELGGGAGRRALELCAPAGHGGMLGEALYRLAIRSYRTSASGYSWCSWSSRP